MYICRKGGHFINLQIMCDNKLRILDCNARFGGTAHDASVWRSNALNVLLENIYSNRERNFWLLGDSGYPQSPFLMTPILSQTTEAEDNYNRSHKKARNCVEQCFGVLKSRFRCLLAERILMYDPIAAGKIINACVILHNIFILNRVPYDDQILILNSDNRDESNYNDSDGNNVIPQGILARRNIVNDYFQ